MGTRSSVYDVTLISVDQIETAGRKRQRVTWRTADGEEGSANTRGIVEGLTEALVTGRRVDVLRDGRGSVIWLSHHRQES